MKKFFLLFLLAVAFLTLASPAGMALNTVTNTYCTLDETWGYTLVHEVTLENISGVFARGVRVEMPIPDPELTDYDALVGTELTPYPDGFETDANGHTYAVYTFDLIPPGESRTVIQRYALDISSANYSLNVEQLPDAYSEQELQRLAPYLAATAVQNSADAMIQRFTQQTVGSETDPYRMARLLFSAVNLGVEYSDDGQDQSATAVLARRSGNCEGFTNLYIACLRAAGIPARQITGYLYRPGDHTGDSYVDAATGRVNLNTLRHTWVEFYLPDAGWVPADPTFTYTFNIGGTTHRFIDWNYFAHVDASRRYLAFRLGVPDDVIHVSTKGGVMAVTFRASLDEGHVYCPFPDIRNHWAEAEITECVERALFNGVSKTAFSPNAPMSRAMFVTVLGRYYESLGNFLGNNASAPAFSDVDYGAYYGDYVEWAVANRLVQGYGEGRFGPDDPVTREQMAVILTAFLKYLSYPVSGSRDTFRDGDAISSWAEEGISGCVGSGLVEGFPDGTFRPGESVTRAQMTAVLLRLDEIVDADDF